MFRPDGPILCFGEILLRLSPPGHGHLFQTPALDAHFGGAEANVAVALARLGLNSAIVSALPDTAVGDAAVDAVRGAGVDVSRIARAEGRLGLYYLTPGAGLRAAAIVYDREESAFARRPRASYDWKALLGGAARLHLSGINPAIGPRCARIALDAMECAARGGIPVSFDGNFRANMWARWCDDPGAVLAPLVEQADLLFGDHRDIGLLLGRSFATTDQDRRAAAVAAFDRFANLRYIATMPRAVHNASSNTLRGRIDTRDGTIETAALEVSGIVDRIGTGDAFAAGVLAGLAAGPTEAAETGLALAALKHATPGDQSHATQRDLAIFREGTFDVRR